MLVRSIYSIVFSSSGDFYLYNSQSNFFSKISKELYDVFNTQRWNTLPEEVIAELKRRELICEDKDIYQYYYTQMLAFNAINNDRTSLSLVIAPTTACNFACPYCFESKKNPKTIDEDTINALGEFVKEQKDLKGISITWYGGEPLLAFDKIKSIYERLSAQGMPKITSQAIITNGYCFTDEIIDFFKENGCEYMQITIDGLYGKHSATRCLKNSSESTFEPIIDNIDKLVELLPNTRIIIRVNINKNNYKEFINVANFIKKRYYGNKMISTYPGIIREESEDRRSLCDSSFGDSEMQILRSLLRAEGFDISDFPKKTNKGCMMQNANAHLIGPEGEIYKCWNDVGKSECRIGNIKQKELINTSLYVKYMTQTSSFNSDECKNCHAFPICSGGCSYYRYRNTFEDCHFDVCSPYKNLNNLIKALLSGELDT